VVNLLSTWTVLSGDAISLAKVRANLSVKALTTKSRL